MKFARLLVVVVVVTICGGLFGGMVGAMIGYAVPTTLDAFFQTQGTHIPHDENLRSTAPPDAPTRDTAQSSQSLRMGVHAERKTLAGAALGGAWGLIFGSMIGIVLATLDQFLIAFNHWLTFRRANPNQ